MRVSLCLRTYDDSRCRGGSVCQQLWKNSETPAVKGKKLPFLPLLVFLSFSPKLIALDVIAGCSRQFVTSPEAE